jgi:hypothetical protein
MGSGSKLLRRTLLQSFLGWLCVRHAFAAAPQKTSAGQPQRLLLGFRRTSTIFRRYRVDATILLCGISIFTRKGVGGSYASVEAGSTSEAKALALQFAAGSWPDRAKGLNRFGILQEVIVERQGEYPEFTSAGLITSSKEEDLGQAKNAFRTTGGRARIVLARGESSRGQLRCWTKATEISSDHTWAQAAALLSDLAREEPEYTPYETAVDRTTTFLAAMRRAALYSQPSFHSQFVHNGKLYSLETHRRPAAAGERTGEIRNSHGQKSADFRTFYATGDDSGIPIRIEYRAKSYLRLVFEFEEESAQSPIASLFSEEAI